MVKVYPLRICPVCNKLFRYNRYCVQLLNDPLPHMRFLCKKKLIEFEQTKSKMRELFESQGIHVIDLY